VRNLDSTISLALTLLESHWDKGGVGVMQQCLDQLKFLAPDELFQFTVWKTLLRKCYFLGDESSEILLVEWIGLCPVITDDIRQMDQLFSQSANK
jgi:hypothetical protein